MRRHLPSIVCVAGLLWAVLVFVQYASGMPGEMSTVPLRETLYLAPLFLGLGWLVGRAMVDGLYSRATLWVVAAIGTILAVYEFWPAAADVWRAEREWRDGVRATAWVLWAMVAGAGMHWGAMRSGMPVPSSQWNMATFGPVAVIATDGGAWPTVLALVWMFALACALGDAACARLRERSPIGLALAVGLTVLMLLALGLGSLELSTPTGILVLLVGCSVLLIGRTLDRVADFANVVFDRQSPTSALAAAAQAGLAMLFAIYLMAAFAPEVGPDALGFRTAGAAHWLAAGAVTAIPDMAGSYGACAGELIHLMFLPLVGTSVAKLVQLGITLLLLLSIARDVLPRERACGAAVWLLPFLASSLYWVQMAWGFVDITQLLFFYGSVLALQNWREDGQRLGWLVACGLCAGAAAAVKLNGGIAAIVAGAILVSFGWAVRRQPVWWLRSGAALSLPFLIALGPILARSWLVSGNPAYRSPTASSAARSHPRLRPGRCSGSAPGSPTCSRCPGCRWWRQRSSSNSAPTARCCWC